MSARKAFHRTVSVVVAAAVAALGLPGPVSAAPVSAAPVPAALPAAPVSPQHTAADLAHAKATFAGVLAGSLVDGGWARRLDAALARGTVDPLAVSGAPARVRAAAVAANAEILRAKGLPAATGSVLEVRRAGAPGAVSLVAAEVGDDAVEAVPAYDRAGARHTLDARVAPAVPVAVVGVDESRTLAAGIDVVRGELAARGLNGPAPLRAAADGFWTTRVMSVRLKDDEEPWIKGDAEIYSIVTGVGVDSKPRVDIVQMPYLDDDGHDYYPGQILVDWSHFRYNAVDAVMMEEDDGTNYRALAQAIATALLTILDGVQYAPMVNAILDAIPDSWFTDDPDYVDSWYVLTRQSNERRTGARGNGTISFQPYFVTTV